MKPPRMGPRYHRTSARLLLACLLAAVRMLSQPVGALAATGSTEVTIRLADDAEIYDDAREVEIAQPFSLFAARSAPTGEWVEFKRSEGRLSVQTSEYYIAPNANSDGSVHTLPYSAIESVSEDDRIVALRMREDGTYMALAKAGFTYGNADDFTGAIERRVAEAGKQMSSQLRRSKRQGPGAAK